MRTLIAVIALLMAVVTRASSAAAQQAPDVSSVDAGSEPDATPSADAPTEQRLAPLVVAPTPAPAVAPPPPPVALPPPPTALPPPPIAREPSTAPNRVGRVTLELLGGTVLGLGGAFSGALVGGVLGRFIDFGPMCTPGCLLGGSLSGGLGALTGVTIGVWGAGRMVDGDGAWGWTLVGAFGGEAVGFSIVLAARGDVLGFVLGGVFPVAGAVLAYELTSHDSRRRAEQRARRERDAHRAASVLPLLAPTPDARGAMLSLVGAF